MSFEIIIDCIVALGSLATAATFILVLLNQKGTQKQINSLTQMAEMFSRHYQLERIQAGSNIYPKIQINLKDDSMWGLKIQIKNNSYPVQVYRMIMKDSIEEKILKMQERKANLADSFVEGNDGSLSKMSKEEILDLFKR